MGVAVVTGAARGIGAAAARRLARDGFQLVLVDRCEDDPAIGYELASKEELDAVVASCGEDQAVALVGDVREAAAMAAAAELAVSRFGGIDAVVAAAGVMGGGSALETSDHVWAAVLDVNLLGVRRLVEAALPRMLERPAPREGRIVAVSSAAGLVGLPRLAAYSAAKHAIVGYVRSLAAELGEEGITANVVAPGSTRTRMLEATASVYGLSSVEEFAQHHLTGRLLEPEEVADAIAWLCRPEAGGVTGIVLPVDGGMSAR